MDAECLSLIVRTAKAEIESSHLVDRLDKLLHALNQRIHRPSEQSQSQLNEQLRQLDSALNGSGFSQLPRSWRSTLEAMGVHEFLGSKLRENIGSAIQKHPFTLAEAHREIQNIRDKVTRCHHAFTKITEGFDFLGIREARPDPGEAKLSILIPREAFHNDWRRFTDEVLIIDQTIGFFSEIITGNREISQIKQLSMADPVVSVAASIPVILGVLEVVHGILGIITGTCKVRTIKAEAISAHLSKTIITMLEGEARKRIEVGLIDIETKLFQQYRVRSERQQTLKTEGKKVLRDLAIRIDNGYQIDAETGETETEHLPDGQKPNAEQQAKNESARRVGELAGRIRNTELPSEPVLRMPGTNGDDDDEAEHDERETVQRSAA
jgi:hypothetical protein